MDGLVFMIGFVLGTIVESHVVDCFFVVDHDLDLRLGRCVLGLVN